MNMIPVLHRGLMAGLLLGVSALPAQAQDELLRERKDNRGIYSVAWENDIFAGSDQHYTNGARFSYLSPEKDIPQWLETSANALPFFAEEGHKRYSIGLGQSMFTPENISVANPDPNDRPYAGWLYGTIGVVSDTGYTLDNLELSLGVVGPSSQAEMVQKSVHSLIDSPDPKGWDHQIKDELAVMLSYERKWRGLYEFTPFGVGMDITPHLGGSVGNVFTQLSTGAMVRVGFDLPADYGPPRIRPSLPGSDFYVPTQTLGGYLFAGVEGRAVGHNIFLDGNTFRESRSVDREPWVGGIQMGVALTYETMRLAYTHVFMSQEFQSQDGGDSYGALTLSLRF